jgi:hypothetical protein
MKKTALFGILALLALPFAQVNCQTSLESPGTVETFPNVLKTAEWASFDYKGILNMALTGDPVSIQKFIKFHATVDGVEGINHGVTCLEMVPLVGDEAFAGACQDLNPRLLKLALDRFMLAQGKTKKEELRQSMTNWAPMTWSVFNGKGLPASANTFNQEIPEEKKKDANAADVQPPSNKKGRE